jgi:demethylmenaquinone methyltransferase/2-methoxy-6-polyprenyl-1,4-benzoquinol methylase
MREYYDTHAPEYDKWYLGLGRFDGLDRPDWDRELHNLETTLAGLLPVRTLDVACGTAFLTRHLRGQVTGLDQSEQMLAIARERMPSARFVQGDALKLPFVDDSFERVVTGHFYGHLENSERADFLLEARRVAPELVVVDAALRPDRAPIEHQERLLKDGSRHTVYKRYFTAESLLEELGKGTVLHSGRWFVVVVTRRS